MNFLHTFFRATPDGYPMKMFAPMHFVMIAVWLAGIYLIYRNRHVLRRGRWCEALGKAMVSALLVDQIIFFSWMILGKSFNVQLNLPLYHCRIAVWFLIFGVLFNRRRLAVIGMWFGIAGSLIAMILIDLYQYRWPHYTNFQFFWIHILLGWIAADFVFVKGYSFPRSDLKMVLAFTNAFNVFLFLLNLGLNSNYGYIYGPPDFLKAKLGSVPHIIYLLFIFLAYNLMICLIWAAGYYLLRPLARRKDTFLPDLMAEHKDEENEEIYEQKTV